jgi:hypothetical protein
MIAIAPEREKKIHEHHGRLKHAFLGSATGKERTQAAHEARKRRDSGLFADVSLDLAEQGATDGDLLAHGLSGRIYDVLRQRWEADENAKS